MPILDSKSIYRECEKHAIERMENLFRTVPYTQDFHLGKVTNREYYKRHLLEAVVRIGLNNDVDTYCLHKIISNNISVAKKLLDYLNEEYGHDAMISKDLERFGLSEEDIITSEPMFSTKLLIAFMYYEIDKEGALPTVVWNWFVEWYSHRYNMIITEKAEQEFGNNSVRNSLAHLKIDEELTHEDDMTSALYLLIRDHDGLEKAKSYLTSYIDLIGMYFNELYRLTIADSDDVNASRNSYLQDCLEERAVEPAISR